LLMSKERIILGRSFFGERKRAKTEEQIAKE